MCLVDIYRVSGHHQIISTLSESSADRIQNLKNSF